MKTTNLKLSAILMMAALNVTFLATDVNAQRRTREDNVTVARSEADRNRKDADRYRKDSRREPARDERVYHNDRNDDRKPDHYSDNREEHHQDWDHHDNRPNYRNDWDRKEYRIYGDFYRHPRYGETYRRFNSNPLAFRHPNGVFYFHHGHFYDFIPGIGYVVVKAPMYTVFPVLPVNCDRFYYHGRAYYRYGDLFFESGPRGYCLIPSPFEFHVTVRL